MSRPVFENDYDDVPAEEQRAFDDEIQIAMVPPPEDIADDDLFWEDEIDSAPGDFLCACTLHAWSTAVGAGRRAWGLCRDLPRA